jgi:threonine/homoserine/homoserine lactone efflux protein
MRLGAPYLSWMDRMTSADQNLSSTERLVYIAAGLGLAAAGAQPRPNPLLNVAALAGGAYLAWSGYKGHCAVRAAFTQQGGSLAGPPAQTARQKEMYVPGGYA